MEVRYSGTPELTNVTHRQIKITSIFQVQMITYFYLTHNLELQYSSCNTLLAEY
jgi:hypothetical protein